MLKHYVRVCLMSSRSAEDPHRQRVYVSTLLESGDYALRWF
jgi:hypothetical protein